MNHLVDVLTAIVGVAMITTLVAHPATASVIQAGGQAFSSSVKAAQGS